MSMITTNDLFIRLITKINFLTNLYIEFHAKGNGVLLELWIKFDSARIKDFPR